MRNLREFAVKVKKNLGRFVGISDKTTNRLQKT